MKTLGFLSFCHIMSCSNRGHLQHWLKAEKEIPNPTAARISAPIGD
jgi:hypothetical protein